MEVGLVHMLAFKQAGAAGFKHAHLAQHLADDGFKVLVVNTHALMAVDALNLVHKIACQVFFTLGAQDVMQFGTSFGQGIACLHKVAVHCGDMLASWHQVFLVLADFGMDYQAALALGFALMLDDAGDFGNHGHVLGLADFKEFGNPGKTAHDILGLGRFAGTACNCLALGDCVAVLDHDDCAHRQEVDSLGLDFAVHLLLDVACCRIHDGNGRLEARCLEFLHRQGDVVVLVNVFLHCLAGDKVHKLNEAFFFRDEGVIGGIPCGKHVALGNFLSVPDEDAGTGRNIFLLDFASLRVDDHKLAALVEHNKLSFGIDDRAHVLELDAAGIHGIGLASFNRAGCGTAYVEGTHGKLGAGLADGLGGNDAHSLADVDQVPAGKVASVAQGAHAMLGRAGQGRAHCDVGDALVGKKLGLSLADKRIGRQKLLVDIVGIHDRVEQYAP